MVDFKAFRKANKWTQSIAAGYFGCDQSFISMIESGKNKLPESFISKILGDVDLKGRQFILSEGEMLKDEASQPVMGYSVPLLPVSAQGESLNDFVASIRSADCERIISPVRGADFAMTVTGDSMSPEYPNGSQILIKRIDERLFIDWGMVYVLDTPNGSVIKKLMPTDNPDEVRCVSINPEFPPFEVSLSKCYGVYRVLLCMSVK